MTLRVSKNTAKYVKRWKWKNMMLKNTENVWHHQPAASPYDKMKLRTHLTTLATTINYLVKMIKKRVPWKSDEVIKERKRLHRILKIKNSEPAAINMSNFNSIRDNLNAIYESDQKKYTQNKIDGIHSVHWGITTPSNSFTSTTPSFLPSPTPKSANCPSSPFLGNPSPLYWFFINPPPRILPIFYQHHPQEKVTMQ